jgi:hypothetical protein
MADVCNVSQLCRFFSDATNLLSQFCVESVLVDVGRIESVLRTLLTLPPPSEPRRSAGPPVGGLSSGVVGYLAATSLGSWYDLPHASPKEGSAAWPAWSCTEGSDGGTDGTNP